MAVIKPKMVILKNGTEVCIRNRTLEDAEEMRSYMESVFSNDRFFMTTNDESREFRTVEKYGERTEMMNGHEHKLLLITEVDGQIVSISDVDCGSKKRNQHVGQVGISIRQDYRGLGLGTVLMQTMIDWATADSVIEKLALGVWAKNAPAIALYRKMGFVEEGRKVNEVKYADGSYDDCICMYRFAE